MLACERSLKFLRPDSLGTGGSTKPNASNENKPPGCRLVRIELVDLAGGADRGRSVPYVHTLSAVRQAAGSGRVR